MLTQEEIKKNLGKYAADFIPSNATIGMGSGSTIICLIEELSIRIRQGFSLSIVATSYRTRKLAAEAGMTVVELNNVETLPLAIDGADEVDGQFNLIKGGGGALLQEKMVAAASEQLIIIADESKYVGQLGKFPLPVEVIPNGWKQVQKKILSLGCKDVVLRTSDNHSFVTDTGHNILDCHFEKIEDAASLNIALHLIPGVVETGFFIGMAEKIVVGYPDGRIEMMEK